MQHFLGLNIKRKRRFGKIRLFSSLPSTNTLLKEKGNSLKGGTVFIAKGQTSGRGRIGKSFASPKGKGIYMSYLVRPVRKDKLFDLTPKTALIITDILKELYGLDARIKWVNDILIDNKKLCGILTEVKDDFAIIGIGLNVLGASNDFPEDLKETVITLEEASGKKYSLKRLAEEIISRLDRLDEMKEVYPRYMERCATTGKRIIITVGNERLEARAVSLNSDFSLTVQTENGKLLTLNSGEVSIRED